MNYERRNIVVWIYFSDFFLHKKHLKTHFFVFLFQVCYLWMNSFIDVMSSKTMSICFCVCRLLSLFFTVFHFLIFLFTLTLGDPSLKIDAFFLFHYSLKFNLKVFGHVKYVNVFHCTCASTKSETIVYRMWMCVF